MVKTPEPVRRWTWPHYYLGGWVARNLCRLLGGYSVHGRENIPKQGGAIICSNHISYLDPPVLGAGFTPRRTYFMAKKELFKEPLGSIIRKCYAFPVDRDATDREAIRNAIELLQKGELVVVFPEGGRSPDGSIQPGNIGPALMATRASVPIIPAALKETDKVLPRDRRGLHRGRVQVDYGQPIHPSQFGDGRRLDKTHLQTFTEAVMQAIEDLQQQQYERVGEVAPPRVKELPDAEKIHHFAVEVSDAEKTAAFYCDLLGFTRGDRFDFPDRGRTIIFVSLGSVAVELLQSAEWEAFVGQPKMLGFKHLCLQTEDVDGDVAKLKAAGVKITTEPFDTQINSRIAFLEDPDGIMLELWQGK